MKERPVVSPLPASGERDVEIEGQLAGRMATILNLNFTLRGRWRLIAPSVRPKLLPE